MEPILFGLHRSAFTCERPSAVALRDETASSRSARRRKQGIGDLGTEAVGQCELLIGPSEAAEVRKGRELVNDDLGRGLPDNRCQRVLVERIGERGAGAHGFERLGLPLVAGEPDHLVAFRHQIRYKKLADRPCRACYEDSHRGVSSWRRFCKRYAATSP